MIGNKPANERADVIAWGLSYMERERDYYVHDIDQGYITDSKSLNLCICG